MQRLEFDANALPMAIERTAALLSLQTGRHIEWIKRRMRESVDEWMNDRHSELSPLAERVLAEVVLVCSETGMYCTVHPES